MKLSDILRPKVIALGVLAPALLVGALQFGKVVPLAKECAAAMTGQVGHSTAQTNKPGFTNENLNPSDQAGHSHRAPMDLNPEH